MADKTAATVRQIKERFPQATAEFIVKAMEEEMAMEDVDAKMMEELTAQVEELKAENEKLHAQLDEYSAKSQEEEEPTAEGDDEPEAEEEEEKKPAAKRSGNQPVAQRSGTGTFSTYKAQWDSKVEACIAKGMSRPKAIQRVNRDNPGLRENYLNEVRG